MPYASLLFGDTPQETLAKAAAARARRASAPSSSAGGRSAAARVEADGDQLAAAREGLGADGILLVDAGTIWREDVERRPRGAALERGPRDLAGGAVPRRRAGRLRGARGAQRQVKLAGGEGAHNVHMARHLIDYGGIGFVQIDCGRIGGIAPAKQVADYARREGRHLRQPHLHLAPGALRLAAAVRRPGGHDVICEYPVTPKSVAWDLCANHIAPDANGEVHVPERPGLGIDASLEGMKRYLVDVEIAAKGKVLYRTPKL